MITDIRRRRLAVCFNIARKFARDGGVKITAISNARIFDDGAYQRNIEFRVSDGRFFGLGYTISCLEIDLARFK
jgi:hypothetical protein